jgi:hypothetical protein
MPQDFASPTTTNDSLLERIADLYARKKAADKALRRAKADETEAIRALALRTIETREARIQVDAIQRELATFLGEPSLLPKSMPTTIGWDEVWCPRCHSTFIPSKFGGSSAPTKSEPL